MNNVLHLPPQEYQPRALVWEGAEFGLFVLFGNHGMTFPANENNFQVRTQPILKRVVSWIRRKE